MDFERADFASAQQQQSMCVVCKTPIGGSYFTAHGQVVCASCQAQVAQRPDGFEAGAFVRALLYGSGVAVAGSAVWYAVTKYTGYEFGLLAIGIGIVLGKAVKQAAGFRGGVIYPVLAVFLTYLSIVGSYVPSILKHAEDTSPLGVLLIALIAPFLGGAQNAIGLVIIAFGLYEAWRYSRVPRLVFEGPFELKA